MATDPLATLEPGRRFGPYEILAKLGEGGIGEVYRARDLNPGRDVAIKILSCQFG
jgi:eukaryotic-like serine/threonine-protein kinase